MKSCPGKALYVMAAALAAALLSSAATILIMRGAAEDAVVMSAEEYQRYSRLIALDELAVKIEEEFYAEVPFRDELIAGAASGMTETLNDPYARYYTAEEYEEYLSSINGEYYGIGLLVGQPDDTGSEVLEVYGGSSAQDAGIKAGDIITHAKGRPTANMPLEDLRALIASQKGEEVALTLLRGSQTLQVTVVSGDVTVNRVEHALFNQYTGYVSISMFTGSCAEEFESALKDLKSRNFRSLVIDLRNNPGGSLDIVLDVADGILGRGMRIVSVGSAETGDVEVYNAKGSPIGVPVAVLVNENSASASEILAAAIQENDIGVVVGTDTYGKGVVQTTMYVEATGGWLKLTTDEYYTPKGNNINGRGIVPDIYAELPEEYREVPVGEIEQAQDTQLWKALDYVREKAEGAY